MKERYKSEYIAKDDIVILTVTNDSGQITFKVPKERFLEDTGAFQYSTNQGTMHRLPEKARESVRKCLIRHIPKHLKELREVYILMLSVKLTSGRCSDWKDAVDWTSAELWVDFNTIKEIFPSNELLHIASYPVKCELSYQELKARADKVYDYRRKKYPHI